MIFFAVAVIFPVLPIVLGRFLRPIKYEKGKMPDKYKDLMEEQDVVALASWLVTFKNTSVNTPKPIKKK